MIKVAKKNRKKEHGLKYDRFQTRYIKQFKSREPEG